MLTFLGRCLHPFVTIAVCILFSGTISNFLMLRCKRGELGWTFSVLPLDCWTLFQIPFFPMLLVKTDSFNIFKNFFATSVSYEF